MAQGGDFTKWVGINPKDHLCANSTVILAIMGLVGSQYMEANLKTKTLSPELNFFQENSQMLLGYDTRLGHCQWQMQVPIPMAPR